MLTGETCFSQQRIISVFGNAHQSMYEEYTADMGQTVMALKYRKKMNLELQHQHMNTSLPLPPSQKHAAAQSC